MEHTLAQAVEIVTTALTVAGMGYFLAAMVAAQVFLRARRTRLQAFTPAVSVFKPLKGIDTGMMDAFRSHCRQTYPGKYELLFGVSSPDDPAADAVEQLKAEFPDLPIQLIETPQRLGTNGKVSTLIQLYPHAQYDFLLINDSDITVSPRYLERVMAGFVSGHDFSRANQANEIKGALAPEENSLQRLGTKPVGLVTALYRGRAHGTLASKFESLGLSTDFQPSILLSKLLEGGLHYGLGSTLAVRREALEKIGGLETLVDHLADDYELGVRIDRAGYSVALSTEVVETSVPAYNWSGFIEHQLRWARTVRDARPGGYIGLVFTYGLCWALLNVLASGLSPLSLWLLSMSFFLRLALAMQAGTAVLGDHQVLPNLWLLPLRDLVQMGLWIAGFAGNTIIWRGERFVVLGGKLQKPGEPSSR
jgi:ceramide glucosyltransferase